MPRHNLCRSFVLSLLVLASAPLAQGSPTEPLREVGSTTLKVMFWTVYDSTLFSPSGNYRGIEPGLALQIEYRRNIDNQRLVDATRDQWQELGLYREQSEQWLDELTHLWPDIQRGDSITLLVEAGLSATSYFNEKRLGQIQDPRFTTDFLAIWLAENTRFPELRDELIGAR